MTQVVTLTLDQINCILEADNRLYAAKRGRRPRSGVGI